MTFARLVWRNLLHNPLRLALTVLSGAVGVMAFIFLQTVVDIFYSGAEVAQADRLIVRNKVAITQSLPLSYYSRIAAMPGVDAVTHQVWFGGRYGESQRDFFPNFSVDPATFLALYDELLVPPEQVAAFKEDPCGALVGQQLASRYGWKVGDRVTLRGENYPGEWTFNVRGIYGARRSGVDTRTFFFGYRCLNERLPESLQDQVGIFVVRVGDPARSAGVATAIDALFANSPYPTKTESERAFQLGFAAMSSAIIAAVQLVSSVILFIILLVIGNTLAMGVRERTRDLTTLRAMGFKAGRVVQLVLLEAVAIGLAAALLGVLAAPVLIQAFVAAVEAQFGAVPKDILRERTLALAALAVVGVAVAAGLVPALRAVRLPVAEGLRRRA